MCDVTVIKIYSTGENKIICGERKENEIVEYTARRIIRENGMRNVGEFIVISRSGNGGAFITQFMEGVYLNGDNATIWVGDTQVLIDALRKLREEAVRDA